MRQPLARPQGRATRASSGQRATRPNGLQLTHICCQVRVNESLVDRQPLFGVERLPEVHHKKRGSTIRGGTYQRLRQEVEGVLRSLREQCVKRSPFADRQRADIIARPSRGDPIKLIQCGRSNDIKYQIKLVAVVATGEQRLPVQQLRENTSNGPKIDRLPNS